MHVHNPKMITWISENTKIKVTYISVLYLFRPWHEACGTLVPQPWIEPGPSAVKALSLNHQTVREFPHQSLLGPINPFFLSPASLLLTPLSSFLFLWEGFGGGEWVGDGVQAQEHIWQLYSAIRSIMVSILRKPEEKTTNLYYHGVRPEGLCYEGLCLDLYELP